MKNARKIFIIIVAACLSAACMLGCVHKHEIQRVNYATLIYRATDTDTDNFDDKLEGTRASVQALLVNKGYPEATVVIEGGDGIKIEIPNIDDASDVTSIIGMPAQISFVLSETMETVLTNADVVKASPMYSPNDGYVVSLELTAEGQEKFFRATSNNIGKTMDIVVTIGDESTVISSPTINSEISGNAIISGSFTEQSSKQLADQINSGTFDVALELIQCDTASFIECVKCGKRFTFDIL